MSTPLFLLFGLTIATCVIAYWADNLGKKLGKKRVTLFGLRPRQTATLITMISSVGIMFFTLATLLLVNSGLRRALLHYDEERAANTLLRADNKQLRHEQSALKLQNEQARQATTQAQKQEAIAQKAASEAKRDLKYAAANLKSEQANLKAAKAQERLARLGESNANLRAKNAARNLSSKQQQLDNVNRNLTGAKTRLAKLNLQLDRAEAAAKTAQAAADKAKADETSAKKSFFTETKRFLKEAKGKFEEVARLEEEQKRVQKEIKQLQLVRNQLATFDTSVLAGWIFDERTITPRTSIADTTIQLRKLVDGVSRVISEADSKRTLRLVIPDGSMPPTNKIIDDLAKYLTTFTVDVSVRVISTRNHALSEPEIQAALVPVPARLVLARGETLAESTVDGSQSDVRIFGQLFRLLSDAEGLARSRGVSPYLRAEKSEPFFFEDTNERLFEALHRIQEIKKSVKVRLVADADISAIDQLRVRFEVVTPEL